MRVIILAASSLKGEVADQLINHKELSKIVISVGSNKLINSAHAVIVYYESKADLTFIDPLLKIYLGVPIKFYFGNKKYDKKINHFYNFQQADEMVNALVDEYKAVKKQAD